MDVVVLQNEKFKDKFPNACKQMEEKLKIFIESNLDFKTQIDICQPDPAARSVAQSLSIIILIMCFYF